MIHLANPIYDSVFKFLMEDERIARTLLSALLKKDIVSVDIRRNEYSNTVRNDISMFRIDFGAHVRGADGNIRLVLIELQKTWLETETLRFRQYLGAQYCNPENMHTDDKKFAIPMVAVYLLGHRVGNIEEPVLYVNHKSFDYDGNEVTKGLPDPFVDSLVHNSIIVQIPLLHGQINNRLEKVLSVFDQSNADKLNKQVINIDEGRYVGDADMEYIFRRLLMAAADPNLRQDMNVEDEFFSAIENRDTEILNREKRIKEQRIKIDEKVAKINEQDAKINEQGAKINEQDAKINEQGAKITEQDAKINEQKKTLYEQSNVIRSMVKNLYSRGMSLTDIVRRCNKTFFGVMMKNLTVLAALFQLSSIITAAI